MQLAQALTALKEYLFPRLCLGCNKPGVLICDTCRPKIPFLYDQICPICQHPSINGLTHSRCHSPWAIDGVVALTKYRGISRNLVKQIKYRGATVVVEALPCIYQDYQKHEPIHIPPAIITPIPLHCQTLNQRGFNQAALIAKQLGQILDYPYVDNILIRHKQTTSQTTFSRADRLSNVRDIFSLNDIDKSNIRGASFILVDDVFTTGATLREAAKVLKRSGAAKVYGFAIAHD